MLTQAHQMLYTTFSSVRQLQHTTTCSFVVTAHDLTSSRGLQTSEPSPAEYEQAHLRDLFKCVVAAHTNLHNPS